MPWTVINTMEQRFRFIQASQEEEESLAELCRQYQISRKTAYKWLARYAEFGLGGLLDRSSRPQENPNQTNAEVERRILELRSQHPSWGPRNLKHYLERREAERSWPSPSTIASLLKRSGLTSPPAKRGRATPSEQPLAHATAANRVWCVDFKGWFVCRDGRRCYPLTLSDAWSRYLLRCQALPQTDGGMARPVLEAAFRQYGLPAAIRSDNGAPFATTGLAGLSRLNVWWTRLGIRVERITPGEPQQNGRHERMHRTLKEEATRPAERTLRAQQRRFDQFQNEYNFERPHEALEGATPAERYRCSGREYPSRLPEVVYPARFQLRLADERGAIRFNSARCYLSRALAGEVIGAEQVGERHWALWFSDVLLGIVDETDVRVRNPFDRRLNRLRLQSPSGLLPPEPVQQTSAEKETS